MRHEIMAALEPFAAVATQFDASHPDEERIWMMMVGKGKKLYITVGDLRAAKRMYDRVECRVCGAGIGA